MKDNKVSLSTQACAVHEHVLESEENQGEGEGSHYVERGSRRGNRDSENTFGHRGRGYTLDFCQNPLRKVS